MTCVRNQYVVTNGRGTFKSCHCAKCLKRYWEKKEQDKKDK